MKTLKMTLKPEGLSLELVFPEEMEIKTVMQRIKTAFPGGNLEAIGGPIRLVGRITQVKQYQDKAPEHILKTSPYAGRKLHEINLHELRSWRKIDGNVIPAEDRMVIDAYLQTRIDE